MATIGCLTGPFHICEFWTLFFVSLILYDCVTFSLHSSHYRVKHFRYNFIEVKKKKKHFKLLYLWELPNYDFVSTTHFFLKQLTKHRNSFFKTSTLYTANFLSHLLTFELIWYSSLPDCTLDSVYTVS